MSDERYQEGSPEKNPRLHYHPEFERTLDREGFYSMRLTSLERQAAELEKEADFSKKSADKIQGKIDDVWAKINVLVEQMNTASEDHARFSKKLLEVKQKPKPNVEKILAFSSLEKNSSKKAEASSHAIENSKIKLDTLLNRQNDAVRVAQMKLGEIKQKNEQIAKVKRELGMIA